MEVKRRWGDGSVWMIFKSPSRVGRWWVRPPVYSTEHAVPFGTFDAACAAFASGGKL